MLTAAFQCPQHPDATCLDRIGDKLKADQFLWGVMAKAPGHQVTVEVHLWSHGKADRVARETYSDNLKDSNDDNLKRVATSLFTKLLGGAGSTLIIHASAETGTVLVDSGAPTPLVRGRATLVLPPGGHTIEVQAPGFVTARREVTVEPSVSGQLDVVLSPDPNAATPVGPDKPFPVRAVAGWSAVAAGGVMLAVGIGFAVGWANDESDLNTQRQGNYSYPNGPQVVDPCSPPQGKNPETVAGCNDVNNAHSALIGEITSLSIAGALVGVGTYLLLTDHPAAKTAPPSPKTGLSSFRIVPSVAPGGGSMVVLGQF
jgi:hypothetical protein